MQVTDALRIANEVASAYANQRALSNHYDPVAEAMAVLAARVRGGSEGVGREVEQLRKAAEVWQSYCERTAERKEGDRNG